MMDSVSTEDMLCLSVQGLNYYYCVWTTIGKNRIKMKGEGLGGICGSQTPTPTKPYSVAYQAFSKLATVRPEINTIRYLNERADH